MIIFYVVCVDIFGNLIKSCYIFIVAGKLDLVLALKNYTVNKPVISEINEIAGLHRRHHQK